MSNSPLAEGANIFSYSILSGGSEIPDSYEVMSMSITKEVNVIATAQITLRDGSSESQSFGISDSDTFKPGAEIEIKIGYQSKNETVFKGVVIKQSIRVDEGSVSRLQITLKDKSVALHEIKKEGTFLAMKDNAIMEQVVSDSGTGISATVDSTAIEHEKIIWSQSSIWDFLKRRAQNNGMLITTDGDKITIAKPKLSAEPELQVQFGYDMIDFDTDVSAIKQYSGVEYSAWDPKTQKTLIGSAEDPKLNKQGNLSSSDLSSSLDAGKLKVKVAAAKTEAELKELATSYFELLSLARFKGSVSFHGSLKAKPNSTIKLMGLSERFNGNAFISGITHNIESGNWQTKATLGYDAELFGQKDDIGSPGSVTSTPPINGLQTGKVTKIDEDPDNSFRIQISMPILGDDSEPIWARLATFYAGNGIGAYFMPEIDDEVILGFMGDDPSDPIILGSVFSAKIPMPETADSENTIKTLITQSKLQIKFDDKNKVFTILTPGENTIVLSDQDKGILIQDQNGNKIQTDDSGVTITDKSNNKIEMASGGITIDSQSALTLKAAQAIKIEGMSIENNGTQSFKATGGTVSITGNQTTEVSGNAQCTVKSSGQMAVKGTMVNIN